MFIESFRNYLNEIVLVFVIIQLVFTIYFYRVKKSWDLERKKLEIFWKDKLNIMVTQTAHDLRSPHAALNVAIEQLPISANEQKKIIVSVLNRIRNILIQLEGVKEDRFGISSLTGPIWLCRSIDLRKMKRVMIVEDDESVIAAWKSKFKNLEGQIEVMAISYPHEFVEARINNIESTFFIVDYDFGSESTVTGLDFIKKYSLGTRAILCTSHFNDLAIQNSVIDLGAKMLPKHMMAEIHIIVETKRTIQPDLSAFKIVLIDDDPIIHWAWKKSAELANVKIDCFFSFDEFKQKSYDLDTPIFIDKNLKGECGLKISDHLSSVYGFSKLYLSTGEFLRPSEIPTYLSGAIFDKMFPNDIVDNLKSEFVKT